jgi:hypothetical protein
LSQRWLIFTQRWQNLSQRWQNLFQRWQNLSQRWQIFTQRGTIYFSKVGHLLSAKADRHTLVRCFSPLLEARWEREEFAMNKIE